VPGFLFWIALLYAGLGTLITHLIGRPLIGLYFQRQHMEADFRFSLARLREYTEQVALLNGEDAEQNMVGQRFGALIALSAPSNFASRPEHSAPEKKKNTKKCPVFTGKGPQVGKR
jgi:ABC-type uncharacterized transport system fused permease/ATPase subunit